MFRAFTRWRHFDSFDGTRIAYRDNGGDGKPLFLLHGLLIDSDMNWGSKPFPAAKRRCILLDARGHGRSDKPHDPKRYAKHAMARDVIALIDELTLDSVDIIGYSLGAHTALEAARLKDRRIRSLVLGGIGNDPTPEADYRSIADEMRAPQPPADGFYRQMAEDFGSDCQAIAAWADGAILPQTPIQLDLSAVTIPILVINGDQDADPAAFAKRLPNAKARSVPGDHISVLEHPDFSRHVVAFLGRR